MNSAVTIRLDDDTLQALDALAKSTDSTRDELVAQALDAFLALNEWQATKIRAGVAAADSGDFATDADIARLRAKFSGAE
jgi:predicted transcriptional regulator